MRFATVELASGAIAVVTPDPSGQLLEVDTPSLKAQVAAGLDSYRLKTGAAIDASTVRFLPPIPDPGKLMLAGPNRRSELLTRPTRPYAFFKFASTLIGMEQPILIPTHAPLIDFCAQFAAVIARPAERIAPGSAPGVIAGYVLIADASRRDFGFNPKERGSVLLSKNTDASTPCGPWLVTPDEVGDPRRLVLTQSQSDQPTEAIAAAEMWFDIFEIVSFASSLRLEPGDIIASGGGGLAGIEPAPADWRPLTPGVRTCVSHPVLGALSNPVQPAAI